MSVQCIKFETMMLVGRAVKYLFVIAGKHTRAHVHTLSHTRTHAQVHTHAYTQTSRNAWHLKTELWHHGEIYSYFNYEASSSFRCVCMCTCPCVYQVSVCLFIYIYIERERDRQTVKESEIKKMTLTHHRLLVTVKFSPDNHQSLVTLFSLS